MQSDSGCDFFCALIAQEGGTGKLVCFSTTASFCLLPTELLLFLFFLLVYQKMMLQCDMAATSYILLLRQNFIFKESSVRKSVKKSLETQAG